MEILTTILIAIITGMISYDLGVKSEKKKTSLMISKTLNELRNVIKECQEESIEEPAFKRKGEKLEGYYKGNIN